MAIDKLESAAAVAWLTAAANLREVWRSVLSDDTANTD